MTRPCPRGDRDGGGGGEIPPFRPSSRAARLGRLNVTSQTGRNAATGQLDALHAFGARSFSVWTASGQLVWDSGDQLEERTRALGTVMFNASNTGNALDDRSDNKGPEPEGVALARFGRKTFAFVGLEGLLLIPAADSPSGEPLLVVGNEVSGTTAIFRINLL